MSASQPFGLDRVGQIHVNAKDLDRAVAFYRDRLGMSLLFQVPTMAFFTCGGVTIMLGTPSAPEYDHPASIIYYEVDDLDAACAALRERAVSFIRDPALIHRAEDHELWMAFLADTEGNTLALMARRAVPPA